ncbi:MAG: hypothetical protein K5656_05155 [Lachnospiraceae bacterium]|nr:hypothetical protein [Lachnospiraceae bacterium]
MAIVTKFDRSNHIINGDPSNKVKRPKRYYFDKRYEHESSTPCYDSAKEDMYVLYPDGAKEYFDYD